MQISVVCSMGLGTSYILRSLAEQIFKRYGIPVQIQHVDLATARSLASDLYITTMNHEFVPANAQATVLLIENVLDTDELQVKIERFLKENQYV